MNSIILEEICALEAIYSPDFYIYDNDLNKNTISLDELELNNSGIIFIQLNTDLLIKISLPYNIDQCPNIVIISKLLNKSYIFHEFINILKKMVKDQHESILFSYIQIIEEKYNDLNKLKLKKDISNNLQVENSENDDGDESFKDYINNNEHEQKKDNNIHIISSSQALIKNKSIFIAHLCNVNNINDVNQMIKEIKCDKKMSKATHNILAYRFKLNNSFYADYDDDGETAAGKRLLKLLTLSNADNVCIIVSRFYGGIKLGPSRFKCINNCARMLLVQENYIK